MRGMACMLAGALVACEGPVTDVLVPLAVVNWYPSGNATCVPRETEVWVTFSEPVVAETLTDETVALFLDGEAVAAARAYDPETWTVHLAPGELLEPDTTYEVLLQPEITAEAGGSFDTEVRSAFSTLPQAGCASARACHTDLDCEPQLCSVTGACVDECAVTEDCPDDRDCVAGVCQ